MPSSRAALAGALMLSLAAPAAGLAQSQPDADTPDIAAAVEATLAADTVSLDAVVTMHTPAADFDEMVVMDLSGQASFGLERQAQFAGTIVELGTASMILDGSDIYMGGDAFEALVPAGSFLYIDMESPPPAFEELAAEFTIGSDAALALYWLLGADGPIEVLGREQIGGVESVHVEVLIDLETVGAHVPPELQAVFVDNLRGIRANGADVDRAEAWIDDDGMVRRVAYDMQAGTPAAPLTLSILYDLSDFGEPIDLGIPEASNIVDAWELVD
jgi:hypothetical protein